MSKELNPKGLQIRKEMFGEEFVAKRMANATDFSRPFVEIINDFAYGEIWTRPGLDRKARSMLTLGMLIALDKPQEIKLHVKVAIKNGVSGSRSSSPGFPRAITLLSSLAYPFRCGGNLKSITQETPPSSSQVKTQLLVIALPQFRPGHPLLVETPIIAFLSDRASAYQARTPPRASFCRPSPSD